jgi:hypothetical protein
MQDRTKNIPEAIDREFRENPISTLIQTNPAPSFPLSVILNEHRIIVANVAGDKSAEKGFS